MNLSELFLLYREMLPVAVSVGALTGMAFGLDIALSHDLDLGQDRSISAIRDRQIAWMAYVPRCIFGGMCVGIGTSFAYPVLVPAAMAYFMSTVFRK